MGLPAGTFALGPDQARLTVRTASAGLGSRLAHNLVIEATRWTGTLDIGDTVGASEVRATVEVASLRVREATGGVRGLSDDDRQEIEGILVGHRGLRADDHPTIDFHSEAVRGELPSLAVTGQLTISGATQPITLSVDVEVDAHDGDAGTTTFTAHATVVQSDYGIEPYSTLFGAIRVADAVDVVVTAPVSG